MMMLGTPSPMRPGPLARANIGGLVHRFMCVILRAGHDQAIMSHAEPMLNAVNDGGDELRRYDSAQR